MVATTELIGATGSAASRLVPIRNGILDQMMGSFGSVDRGGQRPRALHVDLLVRYSSPLGSGGGQRRRWWSRSRSRARGPPTRFH